MQTLTIALSLLVLALTLEEARGLPRPAHKRVRRSSSSDSDDDDELRVCGLVGGTGTCGSAMSTCCSTGSCVNYLATGPDADRVGQLSFQVCLETCPTDGTQCPTGTACETRGSDTTARCWPTVTCDMAGSASSDSSSVEQDPCDACENQFEERLQQACANAPAVVPATP